MSIADDPDPSTLRRIISRLVGQMAMWNATMASQEYARDLRRPPTHAGRARPRQARRQRLGWGDPITWIDADKREARA
jgi:hypothetical protein